MIKDGRTKFWMCQQYHLSRNPFKFRVAKLSRIKPEIFQALGFKVRERRTFFHNQAILRLLLIDPEAWLKTDDLVKPLTLDQNSFYRWQDLDPPIPAEIVRLEGRNPCKSVDIAHSALVVRFRDEEVDQLMSQNLDHFISFVCHPFCCCFTGC